MPYLLSFAEPERAKPIEQWKGLQADGAPPGVYQSNMSREDKDRWKAKVVGTKTGNHQIEIRTEKVRANLVIVVNGRMPNVPPTAPARLRHEQEPNAVKVSANGPAFYTSEVWSELEKAIAEAHMVLRLLDREPTRASALEAVRQGLHPLKLQEACPSCSGRGETRVPWRHDPAGGTTSVVVLCDVCGGTGRTVTRSAPS